MSFFLDDFHKLSPIFSTFAAEISNKQNMLLGREIEQGKLLQLLEKEESQFCVVYGRRRVGKTYLIRETFAGRFTFQHTGLANAPKSDQLREFKESLRAAGMRVTKAPKTWYEAFGMLQEHLAQLPSGKKVLFIDELSWLDTPKSNFISALEHFWNGWATAREEKDIVLVVCGSATSWLMNKVIRNHVGLHNRLTMKLFLQPFTLYECKQYAEHLKLELSDRDLLELYMIMGGIPYYWGFLRRGKSLAQNIDQLFFSADAPLMDEYDALYASLFKNAAPHMTIIASLSTKKAGMRRKELLQTTRLSDNSVFDRALEELEQCNFIRKYYAFGKKEKEALYQLMDNFTLFHFRFIAENRHRDEHYWSHTIETPRHAAWAGLAFERVCLWHLPQMLQALGIHGVVTSAHSWQTGETEAHPGVQIDLLIDRNDNIINLCEMKYENTAYCISKEESLKMRTRKEVFKSVTKTKKAVHLTMVTTYGTQHNAYWNDIQSEITMEDLFAR